MGRRGRTGRRVTAPMWLVIWRAAARVSVVAGLACAVVIWGFWGPFATALGLMVPTFAVSVLVGVVRVRPLIGIALRVSGAIVAAAGVLAAFEWSGAAWLTLLTATSPFVRVLLLSGRLWSTPGSPVRWDPSVLLADGEQPDDRTFADVGTGRLQTLTVSLTELPDAEGLTALDDQAICVAWRRSYLQLDAAVPAGHRLEVVRLRQLYLDELSRRHPAELRKWLASGARAAGNPLPFLEGRAGASDGDPPVEDWDPDVS
jgi:hypothetical protein